MNENKKLVSFPVAVLTLLIVAGVMSLGLAILKLNTMVTFILAFVSICIVATCTGMKPNDLEENILTGIRKSAQVTMIFITVGMVVGSWIISGIVPSIIYYGLKLFTPSSFLALGFVVCCVVSFFTGSAYAALGTMGVAFMAIGHGMGINPALVAGMSVSGSVFGDKMSPFSDTTNMAPATAGTDVFTHIKSMFWTISPAFVVSLVLYFVLGMKYDTASPEALEGLHAIMDTLDATFNISPALLIVPVFTIILVVKKVPATLALLIGAMMGTVVALIFQQQFTYVEVLTALASGFKGEFEVAAVNSLLNRGGISSMTSTIIYTFFALELGEVMYQMGVLTVLLGKIKDKIEKPANLIIATLISCLATVMLTTSQYMAILLPGQVFQDSYKKAKVAPYVLSRTLEDGGTLFAFLVPWSAAAIYSFGVLGVSAVEYVPYAFLPIVCPLCAVVCALTGIGVYDVDGNSLRGKSMKAVEDR
ncbi:MAG: Na+/H+ antiporter NhaC [Firmicutes bacterium]|nr:Na+/H+ antiporter NhaC [Bacillota bacterium]MBQ6685907.1 Na+/H+ antiporter NhaC [Bacillota bacterium]